MDCSRNHEDYHTLHDYKISTVCDSSYTPCRHFVIDINTCDTREMSAFEIFLLLKSNGVVIGHFS